MPGRKHHFSSCPHFGRGSFCHRCAEADRLEAIAKSFDTKKPPKLEKSRFENWGKEQFLAEVARLRAAKVSKRGNYTPMPPTVD